MSSVPGGNAAGGSRRGPFQWGFLAKLLRSVDRDPMSQLAAHEIANFDEPCPLITPPLDGLPDDAASLPEIGSFITRFDTTHHFRERWGERYRANIEALWRSCVSAHRAGRSATEAAGELLLCLSYDWRLDPYHGVAEHEKLAFLRWLVAQIKSQLTLAASPI